VDIDDSDSCPLDVTQLVGDADDGFSTQNVIDWVDAAAGDPGCRPGPHHVAAFLWVGGGAPRCRGAGYGQRVSGVPGPAAPIAHGGGRASSGMGGGSHSWPSSRTRFEGFTEDDVPGARRR